MDSDDRKSMIKNIVKTLKLDENPPASRSRKCSHPFSAWRTMKAPAFRKRWKTPIPTSPTIWTPFWTCMNSTSSASRKPTAWTLTTCCSTSCASSRNRSTCAPLYGARFHHILVDEYQDTNYLQSRFIDMLAREHGQLMVVGDDAQSIYSWRGADMENILSFTTRYPSAKTFKIETNYRSVPEILELSNAAIAANEIQIEKRLRSVRPTGEMPPALVPLNDDRMAGQIYLPAHPGPC